MQNHIRNNQKVEEAVAIAKRACLICIEANQQRRLAPSIIVFSKVFKIAEELIGALAVYTVRPATSMSLKELQKQANTLAQAEDIPVSLKRTLKTVADEIKFVARFCHGKE